MLGVGTWYKSLVDKELQPNESISYMFAYTDAGYRVYTISNTITGRCALLILEWGVATLFQDRDGYMASILEISCTQATVTIKNKSNSNVHIILK